MVNFSADHILKCFPYFLPEITFWHFMQVFSNGECFHEISVCYLGEEKKNVTILSSVDLAQRVEKIKFIGTIHTEILQIERKAMIRNQYNYIYLTPSIQATKGKEGCT